MYDRRGGFGGRDRGRGGFGGGGRFGGGRGFDRGPRNEPAPLNVGEEYDATITEISRKGDGVTRIKNFVVFVPNTRGGDVVHIRITDVRRSHAIGAIVDSSEPEETSDGLAAASEASAENIEAQGSVDAVAPQGNGSTEPAESAEAPEEDTSEPGVEKMEGGEAI